MYALWQVVPAQGEKRGREVRCGSYGPKVSVTRHEYTVTFCTTTTVRSSWPAPRRLEMKVPRTTSLSWPTTFLALDVVSQMSVIW